MKNKLLLYYFALFFGATAICFSQNKSYPPYNFTQLQNNITQRAVSTITQDQQGFIWLGTNGLGLNKYNGIDYTPYQFSSQDSTSLSNSLIHATYVDRKNNVWVATETGLNIYNRNQDNFKRIALVEATDNSTISVQAILEHKNGSILVGTHQHGLFEINPENYTSKAFKTAGLKQINNLLINSLAYFDNRYLLGTNLGIFELDTASQLIKPFSFNTVKGKITVKNSIKTMQIDHKGNIWLGTNNQGLIKIDKNQNGRFAIKEFPITSKRVLSLLSTPRNTILCGTENDGLFELNTNGELLNHYYNTKFNDTGIKSNSIWSLFLDNQQRIWIGYYNNGVGIFDRFYDKFKYLESKPNYPNSLQSSSVTGIQKDELDRLWLGIDGGGIDVYDAKNNRFTHLLNTENDIATGLNSPDVQTLFKDSKGTLWVGTWDYGIYVLEKDSNKFINYTVSNTAGKLSSNRVSSFSEDSNGTIWIGTFSHGIHSFNPNTKEFSNYNQKIFKKNNLNYSDIRKVYVDSEDYLWIGGNAGLYKFKTTDSHFSLENLTTQFYQDDSAKNPKSLIIEIYEDSSKNIWIGTDVAGLSKYEMKSNTFSWLEPEKGFNKITVSAIIEDESGYLWVAGNNGLTRIDKDKNILKSYSTTDGLLANDFNSAAYKDKNGQIYFGSFEGVNYFNPKELPVNKNTPSVYLSDLKLFNVSVKPGTKKSVLDKVISQTKKITLNHEQSVFTIDYAAIDFTRPENIQFAYYLEGFEDNWNYVQNTRSATYTNLPSGDYTFNVKAANSDGIWSDDTVKLKITVLRPWWFSNLAFVSYLFLIIAITYIIYHFIDARLKSKRALEQERENHLQEEALNAKKIQFFTNISHEFRTPLTLILSPLDAILKDASVPEKLKNKHRIIHKNTTRLKRLIDELMDFRKLQFNKIPLHVSAFNIKTLVTEILDYFQEEANQRNIVLSLEIRKDLKSIWADKNKLEKIIFNILSNAFKSTSNNGIITVHVGLKKQYNFKLIPNTSAEALEISIEDTGKGIAADELEKIFNRFYQIKELNEQYFGGTGIGLEVVSSFVNLHRGEIYVESEIGVGTKFRILIPIHEEHYDSTDRIEFPLGNAKLTNQIQQAAPAIEVESDTNKKTLLIVEDNLELRNYLVSELSENYTILEAEDGEEGLKIAIETTPDIIITDVIMPKMNGVTLCSHLKSDLKTSHIPVLMLTAKAVADDWIEGLDSGADAYLNKPFNMEVLQSHLKQLVKNRELLFKKFIGNVAPVKPATNPVSLDQQFILKIIAYIQENIHESELNVEKLADEFSLSRSQLYRKIKALTGLTANEFIRNLRLERAKKLIEESNTAISEISFNVGFSSPSYFSKCFKAHFGILPTEIKKD
ncbi:hybrid sensor histidine kinase/response regulator transcription factor [Leeuwenhoekiella sp. W20_SRS_FM14]|uniref:hybrid sensor histidine kinase/response regulator transcription factor n=1 Tax=Leeuwenhoekiella sp. W20_SRS_FM14 TaxID=3240270 RepID=UPI003F9D82C5